MTELSAAVLLAQVRKLDVMLGHLRHNKQLFKSLISDLPGVSFRSITDPAGELATILTVILPSEEAARRIARDLGTKLVADSGWHVYSNMEHLLSHRMVSERGCPWNCPSFPTRYEYRRGMLPKTDALLARCINIGIGITDPGIGASFGVSVRDGEAEVRRRADEFRAAVSRYLS